MNLKMPFLDRYSVENYLCEDVVIEGALKRIIGRQIDRDQIRTELEKFVDHFENELVDLLVADIATEMLLDGSGPFPRHIERVLEDDTRYEIDEEEVVRLLNDAPVDPGTDEWNDAREILLNWVDENGRVIDAMRGHAVFGALSRLVTELVDAHGGNVPRPNNMMLLVLLSDPCWESADSKHHQSFRRRLRRAVREVRREAPWL